MFIPDVIQMQEMTTWDLSREAKRDRALQQTENAHRNKALSFLKGLQVLPILIFIGGMLHVKYNG
jgi:hypothetical protein